MDRCVFVLLLWRDLCRLPLLDGALKIPAWCTVCNLSWLSCKTEVRQNVSFGGYFLALL